MRKRKDERRGDGWSTERFMRGGLGEVGGGGVNEADLMFPC